MTIINEYKSYEIPMNHIWPWNIDFTQSIYYKIDIYIYIWSHIYIDIDIQYIDYTSLMKYHLNHIWSKKAAYFRSQYAVRSATGKRRGPSGAEDGFLSGENLTKWWEYLWKSKILCIEYIYISQDDYTCILYYISWYCGCLRNPAPVRRWFIPL